MKTLKCEICGAEIPEEEAFIIRIASAQSLENAKDKIVCEDCKNKAVIAMLNKQEE
jgi:DNA-directed RNA polymerase subunit RPC12/RpoP